jgi:hypothetical protein
MFGAASSNYILNSFRCPSLSHLALRLNYKGGVLYTDKPVQPPDFTTGHCLPLPRLKRLGYLEITLPWSRDSLILLTHVLLSYQVCCLVVLNPRHTFDVVAGNEESEFIAQLLHSFSLARPEYLITRGANAFSLLTQILKALNHSDIGQLRAYYKFPGERAYANFLRRRELEKVWLATPPQNNRTPVTLPKLNSIIIEGTFSYPQLKHSLWLLRAPHLQSLDIEILTFNFLWPDDTDSQDPLFPSVRQLNYRFTLDKFSTIAPNLWKMTPNAEALYLRINPGKTLSSIVQEALDQLHPVLGPTGSEDGVPLNGLRSLQVAIQLTRMDYLGTDEHQLGLQENMQITLTHILSLRTKSGAVALDGEKTIRLTEKVTESGIRPFVKFEAQASKKVKK